MTRKDSWAETELHDFLLERAYTPFAWGSNDCATFAADAIAAMTGVDIFSAFRGKYETAEGAFEQITALTGGGTMADAVAHCAATAGLAEWEHPLMAQRGDLVVLMDADRPIAGIVHLNGRDAVAPGTHGLKRFPLTAVLRSWHV